MVAHKSARVCVGSESRGSCGSSQRECDNFSTSLAPCDIIRQELAIRERGSWEDAGIHAADLWRNVSPRNREEPNTTRTYIREVKGWKISLTVENVKERERERVYCVILTIGRQSLLPVGLIAPV